MVDVKSKKKIDGKIYGLNSLNDTMKEAVDRAKVLRRHYHSTRAVKIPEAKMGDHIYCYAVYVRGDRIPLREQHRKLEDADRKYYGYDPINRRKKK